VNAERDDADPGRLRVVLEYRVRATQRQDRIDVTVDLDGR
jgi:hypothetical protein